MSLEAKIEELTTAILSLAAVLIQALQEEEEESAISEVQEEVQAITKCVPPPPPKEVLELDYEKHIKPATIKLSKSKGREAAVNALTHFGVKSAQELPPEQWKDYLEYCEALIQGEA